MCGSIAIVALEQHRNKTRSRTEISQRLENGLAQIKHRGPDSQGQWVSHDDRVALGHVRLEINDLSPSGAQPLHDVQQSVHAVVNGEIYEYDRLRAEMIEKLDYKFQGRSDCELVLALYKAHGLSFVSHLRGEFAICLYDSDKELFIAVRDRYGIKPLFWTMVDGELLVAAEMKAMMPLGWKPEWNVKGIVNGTYQIGAETIFKDVQKVRPGHILISRLGDPFQETQYWDVDYPNKLTKELRTEEEMIEGVRSRLLDAIRVRLRADVKVGVALSGGLDSSVVAGMVNHLIREGEQVGGDAVTEKLSCFCIAFDAESGFDESEIANRTADFLGVKLYKKHMDEQALAERFEDATWMDEQPNPDLNFIGVYALSELVREKGFRVLINGQGSDEIFAGYPLFLPDYLREPDHTFPPSLIPDSVRKAHLLKAEANLSPSTSTNLSPLPSTNHSSFPPNPLTSTTTPIHMSTAYPTLPFKPSLLQPPLHHPTTPHTLYTTPLPASVRAKMLQTWHPLHTASYMFQKAHLENLLLSCLGDRGEMAHGIEGRTPFLDHRLTEYADGLPPGVKIRARCAAASTAVGTGASSGQPSPKGSPAQHADADKNKNNNSNADNADKSTDATLNPPPSKEEEEEENRTPLTIIEKHILREAARPFITREVYAARKHPYSAPLRYGRGGPLHALMKRLVTEENVRGSLGFLEWRGRGLGEVVDGAFGGTGEGEGEGEGDEGRGFRLVICLAQWVVLGRRFGV